MTSIPQIRQSVRDAIGIFVPEPSVLGQLNDDDDLLAVLDSLQILRILMQLESQYEIKIDNSELTPENVGSVEKLAALVARKLDKPQSPA